MLVSPDGRVVHLSEHAGRYLVMPGGEPTMSAFHLVRDELRIELRAMLRTAAEDKLAQRSRPIHVRFNGEAGRVVLDVRPALEPEQEGNLLVIGVTAQSASSWRTTAKGSTPRRRIRPTRQGASLRGMRERVGLLGGEVEIESSPGGGTTLFVRVPQAISGHGGGGHAE